ADATQASAQLPNRIAQIKRTAQYVLRGHSKNLVQPQLLNEQRGQTIAPVIEIARDKNGLVGGNQPLDTLKQGSDLTRTPAAEQAQMHHQAMHHRIVDQNAGM